LVSFSGVASGWGAGESTAGKGSVEQPLEVPLEVLLEEPLEVSLKELEEPLE
jgi:hypothetical protein